MAQINNPNVYSDMDMSLFIESDGSVRILEGEDVINQSIKMILATTPGERVMNPEFGSNLKRYLFEPMTEEVAEDMEDTIYDDISTFEPRVEVGSATVNGFLSENLYEISVRYRFQGGQEQVFVGRIKTFDVET